MIIWLLIVPVTDHCSYLLYLTMLYHGFIVIVVLCFNLSLLISIYGASYIIICL